MIKLATLEPSTMKPLTKAAVSLLILFLSGLSSSAMAQKSLAQLPASERQLIAIKVTGSKRFSEDAIAAESGLQLSTAVTDDDFKRAARHLGDTGAFSDIGYKFSYSSAGTKLEFQVTDAERFVPARFEDFVWFTDEEMRHRIKEHIPLFNGDLPLSGRMPEEVSDVLQAMLVENAIPGHVEYIRASKADGPIEAIQYSVSDVVIRVRNINFTGAGDAEMAALQAAAQRLPEHLYSRTRMDLLVQRQLLPVYYARGYLKAAFGPPQPKPIKEAAPEEDGPRNQTFVDVTFAVTPGRQYRLKAVEWSGNHEFPTQQLQKMVHAEPGQPVNTVRLSENLRDIQTLYGSRGFLKAAIKPDAQFDEATATVNLRLDVKEDFAYHMGELEFRGLDNSLAAKLRNAWRLRPGEVYDATYLSEYLPAAQKLLPPNLDWDVTPHVTANVREKTVDVDLIYSAKAPK
jgi:outer membrane protein insertion porin family